MNKLKQFTIRYTESSSDFIKKSFVFILFLILARFVEIGWVSNFNLGSAGIGFQLYGLLYDLLFALQLTGYLFLPYIALSFVNRNLANVFYIVLTSLLLIVYLSLIAYFKNTSILLGSDFFAYNTHDLIHIVQAGNIPVFWYSLCFILLFTFIVFIYRLFSKVTVNKRFQSVSFFLILLSLFLTGVKLDASHFHNEYDAFLGENKLNFFLTSDLNYYENKIRLEHSKNLIPESVAGDSTLTEHSPLNPDYSFFHKDNTPDVLGNFLNVNPTVKPNIVFIIVESLGTAYSGPANYLGSFTPFLDSLGTKSLYFKDFISSAGRTFQVLPTMLASLPYGETGFSDLKNPPDHLSLPRLLKKNGYSTSFFYGGESKFDNMDAFLKRQKIDHIVDGAHFDKVLARMPSENNGFSWGYGDQELFTEYLSYTAKRQNATPGFDVLLTLSMHSPFLLNNQAFFANKVEDRMTELKLTNKQCDFVRSYKDQFTTIMYFDASIRNLFKELSKRPAFKNTIFVITGDHRMPEIPISTQIDRFHVPLIIYSPLLKRTKSIEAVSSQFDITPTFVALLRNSYQLKFPANCHWIGFELDTAAVFRSRHAYPIMRNKNEMVDFLAGTDFLSMNKAYKINKAFEMVPNNNPDKTKEMINRLFRFQQLNAIACQKNKLLPDSIYLKW
ncbi:MAG: LTA synthase family protein [Paludibacter sp.]|nr:LTA synthase family protein [Paludibacter sp.]